MDNIIFGSNDDRLSHKFSKEKKSDFKMSPLGGSAFFLGLQISQLDESIFISQTKYIKEMLKKFGMEDFKPVSTPMVIGCKLRKYDEYKEEDQRICILTIGNLQYVTASRPDVMQAVGQVAIFQEAPKETHFMEIKRIFRYLKGKTKFVLWYRQRNELTMVAYTDADWEGRIDDRISTSGETFYLGDFLVSWLSKKQYSVSFSTT
jgi:hypothetical protein